ncbi:MarR family winged helix-turn-helix transcriptional regulator [Seohaeicola zhoushanensis]|uniref:Transcriptional regulator n=1 Tax=Seohaeicola zhoushanensis TaxID=1569283 RepID=A0A8J3M7H2_9RHOB|nr:MarR family transcriptional regulator [Seohaeicola zhoushanensis]GHF52517.1 transcriptional regulator [Seohaeicola zhoushanensis]
MAGVMRDLEDLVEPEALTGSVSYRLRLLQIAAYKSFEKTITGFGAAPRYYGMLKLVQANPGIHQMRLAEAIFLDRSSLVPIIEILSREGWLERRDAKSDRRVKRIFLTDEGQDKLARLEAEVARHEAVITDGFTPAELDRLRGDLARIDANLRGFLAAPNVEQSA